MKRLSFIIAILAVMLLPISAYAAGGGGTVSLGARHALAVTSDGGVWAWGNNDWGQLGDGTSISKPSPVKVMDGAVAVSAGSMHSMALKADGTLWAWGYNGLGALGDGTTVDKHKPVKVMDNVKALAASNSCSYAVKTDGSLWGWGTNIDKNLADGTRDQKNSPIKIMDDVAAVDATLSRSIHVIKTDGSLWAWGFNRDGWLGIKTNEDPGVPIKVMDGAAAVSGNLLIKADGGVWQLAPSDPVILPSGEKIWRYLPNEIFDNGISIAANWDWYSLAVNSSGDLYVWVQPVFKDGGAEVRRGLADFSKLADNVAETASGANAGMFVKNDGSLWAWGENQYGQLGTGKSGGSNSYDAGVDEQAPVKIMDDIMIPAEQPAVTPTPIITPSIAPSVTPSVAPSVTPNVTPSIAPSEAPAPAPVTSILFAINNKQYTKNGDAATFDVAPYIDAASNRTMVPIRFIAEALGAKVVWDNTAKTDTISLNGKTLVIALNQPLPNNMGSAIITQNRLLVPIRYVSEQLGATVEWDAVNMLVSIKM